MTITGTATAGTASISTGSVVFGAVPITTTVGPMSFMISNTGTAPLTVYSIQISRRQSGEFTETDNCVGTISIGGNCTVMVKFTPSTIGLRTANLIITDNSGVCRELQHHTDGEPERHGHGLLDIRLARLTDCFARQSCPLHADPEPDQRFQRHRNLGM